MSGFQSAKLELVHLFGLPKDALHIYIGLAIFLGTAMVFRRSLRSWLPIGCVLAAALVGEAWDHLDGWRYRQAYSLARSWHDLWNTLFWPAVLFLLARYTRLLRR